MEWNEYIWNMKNGKNTEGKYCHVFYIISAPMISLLMVFQGRERFALARVRRVWTVISTAKVNFQLVLPAKWNVNFKRIYPLFFRVSDGFHSYPCARVGWHWDHNSIFHRELWDVLGAPRGWMSLNGILKLFEFTIGQLAALEREIFSIKNIFSIEKSYSIKSGIFIIDAKVLPDDCERLFIVSDCSLLILHPHPSLSTQSDLREFFEKLYFFSQLTECCFCMILWKHSSELESGFLTTTSQHSTKFEMLQQLAKKLCLSRFA